MERTHWAQGGPFGKLEIIKSNLPNEQASKDTFLSGLKPT